MAECALVTIAVGEKYRALLQHSAPFFKKYSKKYGLDFVAVEDIPTALPSRYAKFAAGKLLEKYERLLIADSDVFIVDECPDILSLVPKDHVGAYLVSNDTDFHDKAIEDFQKRLPDIGWRRQCFNSGVIVVGRQHQAIFDIEDPQFSKWVDANRDGKIGPFMGYDQPYLNYKIKQNKFPIFDLGYKFNHTLARNDSHKRFGSYVIHCKGHRRGSRIIEMQRARFVLEHPSLRDIFVKFPSLVRLYDII